MQSGRTGNEWSQSKLPFPPPTTPPTTLIHLSPALEDTENVPQMALNHSSHHNF